MGREGVLGEGASELVTPEGEAGSRPGQQTGAEKAGTPASQPGLRQGSGALDAEAAGWDPARELSLAVHVPFRYRPDAYNAGLAVFGASEQERHAYAGALAEELESLAGDLSADGRQVGCVHITGVAPQLLAPEDIAAVVGAARAAAPLAPDAEVLVDVMPGKLSREGLDAYLAAGVTRLLFLMETSQAREDRVLDRSCDPTDMGAAAHMLQEAGFGAYGVQLLYGLPFQTRESLGLSLADAYFHRPEFVRLRAWGLRPGCKLYDRYVLGKGGSDGLPPLPGNEERLEMLRDGERFLRRYAYRPLTCDAFALPRRACRCALAQASGGDFVGVGLGAASLLGGMFWRNTDDLAAYLAAPGDPARACAAAGTVAPADRERARLAARLHLAAGVSEEELEEPRRLFPEVAARLGAMEASGLLERHGGALRLSERAVAASQEPDFS